GADLLRRHRHAHGALPRPARSDRARPAALHRGDAEEPADALRAGTARSAQLVAAPARVLRKVRSAAHAHDRLRAVQGGPGHAGRHRRARRLVLRLDSVHAGVQPHGPARGLRALRVHQGRIANRIANRGSPFCRRARAPRLRGLRACAAVAPTAAVDRLTSILERRLLALALRASRPQFLPRGSLMKLASVLGLCLTVLVALVAAGASAQTMTSPDTTSPTTTLAGIPTVSASPATTATPVVLNIVEITRLVPSGTTAVSAFTVPAGQTLIVTDALVTNTGTAATCGAAINRVGGAAAAVTTPAATTATGTTATTPTTTGTTATAPGTVSAGVPTLAGTLTQTDSTITGPLCVAARTTTP